MSVGSLFGKKNQKNKQYIVNGELTGNDVNIYEKISVDNENNWS